MKKTKIFKLVLALFVIAAALLAFASCDGGDNSVETPTPTEVPMPTPTEAPTAEPTEAPTAEPTEAPTAEPTEAPTAEPTEAPTAEPTEAPTAEPTEAPTAEPTEAPTAEPTEAPTSAPTENPTENPTEDKGNSGAVLEAPESLDGTTYGNQTFTIYSLADMFDKRYFFADKLTGDGMNDALYQRKQTIEELLGVQLIYREAEGYGETAAYQVYADEVKNAIKAGVEKYQLVGTHAYYAIPDLITTGSLTDFNEFESIDLNKEYWNKKIMDQVAYKGHYYLGYSNYNLATTCVVGFNKDLYNEFSSAFNGNTMYDYVNNGQWTLAKMSEVASYVYKDQGDVTHNTYGLSGEVWVPFCGFIQSSGESIVKKNEQSGGYELTWYDNAEIKGKINNLVETLKDIRDMKEVHFWLHPAFAYQGDTTQVKLSSGKVFMELMHTGELIYMKETRVKFGVVPYPMYDENQYKDVGYQSLSWAGYIAVPSNITNTRMVSDVLECLAFYSDDVTTYYYEKLLGCKLFDAPDDAMMLDIVWDSLCADFGVTFAMIDDMNSLDAFVYAVPNCVKDDSSFAILNATRAKAAQNALNKHLNNS